MLRDPILSGISGWLTTAVVWGVALTSPVCGAIWQTPAAPSSAVAPEAEAIQAPRELQRFVEELTPLDPERPRWNVATGIGLDTESATPQRLVRGLQISTVEVTQELWQEVMGANPSRWKGPRNSVEMLTFAEAIDFCQRLTTRLRRADLLDTQHWVRLPTEFEWEFAARAGTDTAYSFGDAPDSLGDFAWYTGNAAGNDPPVGAKQANPWGLYDVHGYLWEYCLPTLDPQASWSLTETGWAEAWADRQPAIRGGSWKDPAERLRSGWRQTVASETRDDAIGLRVVVVGSLPPEPIPSFEAELPDEPDALLVPANATFEWLWNEGEFTEGPAAGPDGAIYFSDIGNRLLKWDSATRRVVTVREPSGRSNGLMFLPDAQLVACEGANTGGGRRVSIGRPEETPRTLSWGYQGKRFNSPNDLVVDAQGRVFVTDPRYVGDEPRELEQEAVYVIDPDGTTRVATAEVSKPNGIVLSPDGRWAYVADHPGDGPRTLLRFVVTPDGTFAERDVLFDFGDERGIDGMTVDREGRVYATAGSGSSSGIYVFTPEGQPLAFVPTPGAPTNCVFGRDAESSWLYVTGLGPATNEPGAPRPYGLGRIRLNTDGFSILDATSPSRD